MARLPSELLQRRLNPAKASVLPERCRNCHRGRDGDAKGRVRDLLREVTTLEEAAALLCEAVIGKISSLSMIPAEDISEARPISEFGMDSLVAVEMGNWLFREMDATVPILELLANSPLTALATKIAKRSKIVNPAVLAKSAEE